MEKLNKTLKRIGCESKRLQEDGYVVLEEVPSTTAENVAERVKFWIDKISH